MMTKDENKDYQAGYRDGTQDQMNKQFAAFRTWFITAVTAALFGAIAYMINTFGKGGS